MQLKSFVYKMKTICNDDVNDTDDFENERKRSIVIEWEKSLYRAMYYVFSLNVAWMQLAPETRLGLPLNEGSFTSFHSLSNDTKNCGGKSAFCYFFCYLFLLPKTHYSKKARF